MISFSSDYAVRPTKGIFQFHDCLRVEASLMVVLKQVDILGVVLCI